MDLASPSHRAFFNPHISLISWGVEDPRSQLSLLLDERTPLDFSTALHEFSHQDALFSHLGIWYLERFWGHLALTLGGTARDILLGRSALWDAYWTARFLLEGHALYAQLHLHPSPRIEGASKQYGFMANFGIATAYIGRSDLIRGVDRLFTRARDAAHASGLKKQILLDQRTQGSPYLLGYLLFRHAQAYLAQFESAFRDSELFLVFFSHFLFNNLFERLLRSPGPFDVSAFFATLAAELKSIGPVASTMIDPIVQGPEHPIDYFRVDYLDSRTAGRLVASDRSRHHVDQADARIQTREPAGKMMAEMFRASVMCLGLVYLKSVSAWIVGLRKDGPWWLTVLCGRGDHASTLGFRVDDDVAESVRAYVREKGKRLLRTGRMGMCRVATAARHIDHLMPCEGHVLATVARGAVVMYLATKDRAFVIHDPWYRPTHGPGTEASATSGAVSAQDPSRDMDRRDLDGLLGNVRDIPFVRSIAYRTSIMEKVFAGAAKIENVVRLDMERFGVPAGALEWMVAASRDRLQDELVRFVFGQHARWAEDRESPLVEFADRSGLLPELEEYCYRSPVLVGDIYCAPKCPDTLERIGEAFASGTLFDGMTIGTRPPASELL